MHSKIALIFYIIWLKVRQFFSFKRNIPCLLIVKIDAIGDYILFRNYLNEIATSSKYEGHKITLVGNSILKDLIFELDGRIIENYISVDHHPSRKNWFSLLKELTKFKYQTVINFHYSRTISTEIITFAVSASEKTTMNGDNLRIKPGTKKIFNLIYSSVIRIPSNLANEFEFNRIFTESIVGYKINYSYPSITLTDRKYSEHIHGSPYIVIAPGAGVESRRLNTSVLIELTAFLLQKYTVCFVGSAMDALIVNAIKENIPEQYLDKLIDMAGKTSLNILPHILDNSLCVVCTDSGPYHMSVALNKPVLCVAGGGHFKRFVQYKERENIAICHKPMACYNCNWQCIFKFSPGSPYPCISPIGIDDILEKFKSIEQDWLNEDHKEIDRVN